MSALKLIKLQCCKKSTEKFLLTLTMQDQALTWKTPQKTPQGLRHGEGHGVEVVEFFAVAKKSKTKIK